MATVEMYTPNLYADVIEYLLGGLAGTEHEVRSLELQTAVAIDGSTVVEPGE